jgi:hypothetical protein
VHNCGNTKILATTNTPDSQMLHGHVHASHDAWCCAALPAKGGSAEGSHLALLTKILCNYRQPRQLVKHFQVPHALHAAWCLVLCCVAS